MRNANCASSSPTRALRLPSAGSLMEPRVPKRRELRPPALCRVFFGNITEWGPQARDYFEDRLRRDPVDTVGIAENRIHVDNLNVAKHCGTIGALSPSGRLRLSQGKGPREPAEVALSTPASMCMPARSLIGFCRVKPSSLAGRTFRTWRSPLATSGACRSRLQLAILPPATRASAQIALQSSPSREPGCGCSRALGLF